MFEKLAVVFLVLGISMFLPAPSVEAASSKEARVQLNFEHAMCGGTTVAPDKVLTAFHCMQMGETLVAVDGRTVEQVDFRVTGVDQVVIKVRGPKFKVFPKLWTKTKVNKDNVKVLDIPVGTNVHWTGSPEGLYDQFRRGYVTGEHMNMVMIDAMTGHGDSGSGVYTDGGVLIGVVSQYISLPGHEGHFLLVGLSSVTDLEHELKDW